jgi:hypothetical protein
MNKKNYPLSDLNAWLGQVEEVNILLPQKPRLDQVAAAAALSDSLNKSSKKTQILCPRSLTVEFSQVIGVDKIANQVEGRSFIININYPLKNIEKINWDDQEEERVSLVIEPKSQAPAISQDLVEFKRGDGRIKNIIALGFSSRAQLDQAIHSVGAKDIPNNLNLINVNIDQVEFFGQIKLIDTEASSFSEVVAGVIEGLSLSFGSEAAQNLLLGLQAATNSFSLAEIGPGPFEAAAFCLRAGGQLENKEVSQGQENQKEPGRFSKPKIYRGSGQ